MDTIRDMLRTGGFRYVADQAHEALASSALSGEDREFWRGVYVTASLAAEADAIAARLAHLRQEIENERISYAEIAELQSLAEHIDPSDVLLLEWAGVPEHA